MYIISALLIVILIILYRIYNKSNDLYALLENERKYKFPERFVQVNVKDWLGLFNNRLRNIENNIQNIDSALNYENPAGPDSANSKRITNLVKIYSAYLEDKEQLSKNEANAKATFEFSKFEHDKLIYTINRTSTRAWLQDDGIKDKDIEKNFFETGLLEKDCLERATHLIPVDVFEPVWALFKFSGPGLIREKLVHLAVYQKSYEEYIKNRAIILRLLDLRIVEKVPLENSDSRIWLCYPLFEFKMYDIDKIRSIIYGGISFHDDNYFEERHEKGEIKSIFQITIPPLH